MRVWSRVVQFLVPAAVTVLVGLWAFTRVPLSNDEAVTVGVARRGVGDIIETIRHVDAVHGVYYLAMHFVVVPFGSGATAVRVPSLIGTAIAAGLVALLGEALQSRRAGLLAGLLFACAPAASQYAQDARPYGLVYALVVGLTMTLLAALTGPRPRLAWIAYAVILLVAVAMHLFVVLILPAYAVVVAVVARRRRSWRPVAWWAGCSAIAITALTPLIHLVVAQRGTAAWIRPPNWQVVLDLLVALAGGAFLLGASAVLVAFGYRDRVRHGPRLFMVAAPWLLLPPALLMAGSVVHPLYAFRYVAYCVPALALLAGAALDRLRWWLMVPVLAVLVTAGLPEQNAIRYHPAGVSGVNDLRAVARFLSTNQEPGDGVIYVAPGQRYLAAAYPAPYASLIDVTVASTPVESATISGTDVAAADVPARLAGIDRVWTVKYFIWPGGETGYRNRERQIFQALHDAGFVWQYTARLHGSAIALWVRPG